MAEVWFLVVGVGVVLMVIQGALLVLLVRRKGSHPDSPSMLLVQQQIQELSRAVDEKIGQSSLQVHQAVQAQLSESAKLIREVTEGLTKLDDTNRQVVGFAEQLRGLQDVLKNPKQRGVLGEYYLESVLRNVLPPGQFQMQYKFEDGEIVDAVVFLDGHFVPVDSKFSLENYNRLIECRESADREHYEKLFKQDLKNRIDETSKYIRPAEGTMDFAFMFVPSEAIYYDLLVNQVGAVRSSARDLIEYAFQEKKVIIVSPTSFLAYLQTVLQGLRALQIEKSAMDVRKRVEELGKHLINYDIFMKKLGGSLGTTINAYNTAYKELGKIDKDVVRITDGVRAIEPEALERPREEA
jgi:DNA recombination protein RmuC